MFATLGLGELMASVHQVGTLCFPGTSEKNHQERLFAHQYGDGFLVCSDFPERDASRAIGIAVAIMRHMIVKGYVTKAAISVGDLSDIRGLYPCPMRDAENGRVDLGMGLMTIISVMGTALTRAHKLAATKNGAVLVIDEHVSALGLPDGVKLGAPGNNNIDWVYSNLALADQIADKCKLQTATASNLQKRLQEYCACEPTPPDSWVQSTFANINA